MKCWLFLYCFCTVIVPCLSLSVVPSSKQQYDAIYSFGDSLTDTGNFLLSGALAFPTIGSLPYGETFFRHPTGRCSNGRLVLDFLAEEFGLHYLPPYLSLAKGQRAPQGVNFAVAGATALDSSLSRDYTHRSILWTNDSLSVQLGWFRTYKSSLCSTKQDCANLFKKSLFVVGEIGGNDYNFKAFLLRNVTELSALVPQVTKAISGAISMLIEDGASSLLVPGNLPVGCVAIYLTLFQSSNQADYDENGCLKAYNAFASYHNEELKFALEKLRAKYPQARIMYGDFYGAAMQFYHVPGHHGFKSGALKACCGGGGRYNFNYTARCGHPGYSVCDDPSTYANWDGIHLTESAYRTIATGLVHGPFSSPSLAPLYDLS